MKIRDISTNELKRHPLIDELSNQNQLDSTYAQLLADIKCRGIVVPIQVNQDLEVLDGNHRLKAAIELSIERVPVQKFNFENKNLETQHILQSNLTRKHLTTSQKWILWAEFSKTYEIGRGGLRVKGKKELDTSLDVNSLTGNRLGISSKTIGNARRYQKLLIEFPNIVNIKPSEVVSTYRTLKKTLKNKALISEIFKKLDKLNSKQFNSHIKEIVLVDKQINNLKTEKQKRKLSKAVIKEFVSSPDNHFTIKSLLNDESPQVLVNSAKRDPLLAQEIHNRKTIEEKARLTFKNANDSIERTLDTCLMRIKELSIEYSNNKSPLKDVFHEVKKEDEFLQFKKLAKKWCHKISEINEIISKGGYGFYEGEMDEIKGRLAELKLDGRSEYTLKELFAHSHQVDGGLKI